MTKHITQLLLCICVVSSTLADDRTERAHTPTQSPFHALGDETLAWPRSDVEYEGRATISARYRFVFDEESSFEQNPHLYFEPSSESQSQLPYLTRWVHESEGSPKLIQWIDPAKEIWVTNVAEAAVALLGKSLARN